MEILNVGGIEFFVVVMLAALILGPERLARAMREGGKLVRNLKAYFSSFSDELKSELDILDEIKEIKRDVTKL